MEFHLNQTFHASVVWELPIRNLRPGVVVERTGPGRLRTSLSFFGSLSEYVVHPTLYIHLLYSLWDSPLV